MISIIWNQTNDRLIIEANTVIDQKRLRFAAGVVNVTKRRRPFLINLIRADAGFERTKRITVFHVDTFPKFCEASSRLLAAMKKGKV